MAHNQMMIVKHRRSELQRRYVIYVDQLYRTMWNWLLLKCIACEENNYILREVQEESVRHNRNQCACSKDHTIWVLLAGNKRRLQGSRARACHQCQIHFQWPSRPAERISLDYFHDSIYLLENGPLKTFPKRPRRKEIYCSSRLTMLPGGLKQRH